MNLKKHKGILILLVIFLLVKVLFLLKFHLVSWDEAVYLGMGKYIFSLGEVGLWEVIRPPGLPLFFGFLWWAGLPLIFSAEILEVLFSLGVLVMVYLLGLRFSKRASLWSVFLLGSLPVFFAESSKLMTGIPGLFFSLLALYLFLKKRYIFSGLLVGLSFLFRFPYGLMLAALLVLLFLEKEEMRSYFWLAGGFFISVVPFMLVNYFLYRGFTSNFLVAMLRPVLLGFLHADNLHFFNGWHFYFKELFFQNYVLVFSLVGLGFVFKEKLRKYYFVVVPLVLFFSFFLLIKNRQLRFALAFLPYLCLLAGFGLSRVVSFLWKRKDYVLAAVLLFFIVGSFYVSFREDKEIYDWLLEEEHELVDVYKWPEEYKGVFLTTHPGPAAYTDGSFIPVYDRPRIALFYYRNLKEKVEYFFYFDNFYPCFSEECERMTRDLEKDLAGEELAKERDFPHGNYSLYRLD